MVNDDDITKEQAQIEYDTIIENRKINLIEKSKTNYTEVHHIIPSCLGGSDEDENLVRLTSEEHYLAHWYLFHTYDNGMQEKLKTVKAFEAMHRTNDKHSDRFTDAKKYQESQDLYLKLLEIEGLEKLKNICDFWDENGRKPSRSSWVTDEYELSLANRISSMRCSIRGTDSGIFFESYEEYAIERGYRDLFNISTEEEQWLQKIEDLFHWIDENGKPKFDSANEYEVSMNNRIVILRTMKHKKKNWCESFNMLSKERGYEALFDFIDVEQNNLDTIKEVYDFYTKHSKKPQPTTNKKLCRKFHHLKGIRENQTTAWKQSYEDLIQELGCVDLFKKKWTPKRNESKLEEKSLANIKMVCNYVKDGGKILSGKHIQTCTDETQKKMSNKVRNYRKTYRQNKWKQSFFDLVESYDMLYIFT